MVPTAFSQVFEQIVNAIVSVAAGSFLFNQALKTEVLKIRQETDIPTPGAQQAERSVQARAHLQH